MKAKVIKQSQPLSPEAEIALIRKKLKHFTTDRPVKYWLDTGSPRLNSIFGSKKYGIPYAKMIEISGFESQGKTALVAKISAISQRDGAIVIWVDLENSWDEDWFKALGLDTEKVYLFQPQVGTFDGEKEQRLQTAEELLEEVDELIRKKGTSDGRMCLVIDSIAALLTEEEAAAGIQNQNMRTKISLAPFLSRLLRRWVAVARNYNVMMFFVNQLRVAPNAFGNPEYTPGGNAVRLYASVRVRMRRKTKKILKGGEAIGIKGMLINWKNKAGGESREGLRIGYKLYYEGRIKYVDEEAVQNEGTE